MHKRLFSWCACASLCVGVAAVRAQAAAEAAVKAASAASAPASAPAQTTSPLIGLDGHAGAGSLQGRAALLTYQGGARQDDSLPVVTVIALPPELRPGRPPGRSHHALSLRSESSTQALRSMGFDVTDCATRFRFPSRFKQSTANTDGGFEASAQVSWLCRF